MHRRAEFSKLFPEESHYSLLYCDYILPILTTVVLIAIVWRYRNEINEVSMSSTNQTQLTGVFLTGDFYAYIFCVDVSSVIFFGRRKHEYKDIITDFTSQVSLHCTYVTLTIEILLSVIAAPLVAWLTEPLKTTSVAILALALIILLYIMNKILYCFAKAMLEFFVMNILQS